MNVQIVSELQKLEAQGLAWSTKGFDGDMVFWVPELPVSVAEIMHDTAKAGANIRQAKSTHVKHFHEQIVHDQWVANTWQFMIVGDGGLEDGNHRCTAFVKASKPIPNVVIRVTTDKKASLGVDENVPRSASEKATAYAKTIGIVFPDDSKIGKAWKKACEYAWRGGYQTTKMSSEDVSAAYTDPNLNAVKGEWTELFRSDTISQNFHGGPGFWGYALWQLKELSLLNDIKGMQRFMEFIQTVSAKQDTFKGHQFKHLLSLISDKAIGGAGIKQKWERTKELWEQVK